MMLAVTWVTSQRQLFCTKRLYIQASTRTHSLEIKELDQNLRLDSRLLSSRVPRLPERLCEQSDWLNINNESKFSSNSR